MFKVGDLVKLRKGYESQMLARPGALAKVTEVNIGYSATGFPGSMWIECIRIEWLRDNLDMNQSNGMYSPSHFSKVREEARGQKKKK